MCPELIVQPSASAPAQWNPILFGRFVRLTDSEGTRTSCRESVTYNQNLKPFTIQGIEELEYEGKSATSV